MVKAQTLKTLKVKVKADGTLSKKSLEDVQGLTRIPLSEKLLAKIGVSEAIDIATFSGLTVGIKFGLINPLSFLLGVDWFPGKNVGTLVDDLKDGLRQAFESGFKKRESELTRRILLNRAVLRTTGLDPRTIEQIELEIQRLTEELTGIPQAGSEEEEAEFGKWFADNRTAIEWLVSMGMAGWSIKFAEQHTIAELAELIPGQ